MAFSRYASSPPLMAILFIITIYRAECFLISPNYKSYERLSYTSAENPTSVRVVSILNTCFSSLVDTEEDTIEELDNMSSFGTQRQRRRRQRQQRNRSRNERIAADGRNLTNVHSLRWPRQALTIIPNPAQFLSRVRNENQRQNYDAQGRRPLFLGSIRRHRGAAIAQRRQNKATIEGEIKISSLDTSSFPPPLSETTRISSCQGEASTEVDVRSSYDSWVNEETCINYNESSARTELLNREEGVHVRPSGKKQRTSGDNNAEKIEIATTVEKQEREISNQPLDNTGKGTRVAFSASEKASRSLTLNEVTSQLLSAYMTQPVEQYAVLTIHDHNAAEAEKTISLSNRRWIVRRLTKDESSLYYNKDSTTTVQSIDDIPENYFRLAVPLLPLLGLDLTPVIDLEVLVNQTNDIEKDNEQNRWALGGWMQKQSCGEEIKIKSLRVSLLSTDEEIRQAMSEETGERRRVGNRRQVRVNNNQIRSSIVSSSIRDSVIQIGPEAIGMVGQLEEWIKPHLEFEARITWSEGDIETNKKPLINVKATAKTSLIIPSLPIAVPFPSGLIVKKLGHLLLKRALNLGLPQFLRQLEGDLKRWSSVDVAKNYNDKTSE
eukprot:CAMPEP_0195519014 /NCGR_PEP_ID=MMETSP0794_2-20130614/14173_1 /TAXON_ID=515487 /ORGANISM="Stephanopyxis turris, Strain CCMP 815" /LENGTH=606 /DNA_ID=CAMNT_0040648083 /DNA_START=497 /DNA_END=2317 /DNA_ORIENTATION=+